MTLGEPAPTAGTPLVRPRRLVPRYPTQLRVRLRAADQVHECDARDVSRGGLFIASDRCPDLFSPVELWVPLPEGNETRLSARVVHVVSQEKAEAAGVTAGMGLEFEGLNAQQLAAVSSLVNAARAQSLARRVVKLRTNVERNPGDLDAMLGYLLDAVDDRRDPEALSESLGIPLDTTEEMLHELLRLQLIELGEQRAAPPRVTTRPAPPVETTPRTATPNSDPLAAEVRARLDALFGCLDRLSHYEMLGVCAAASGEEIRNRFFELGRLFHPDTYYGRPLGADLRKLERVFARLSEAYGTLSRDKTRAEYDEYLARKRALSQPPVARPAAWLEDSVAPIPHIVPHGRARERGQPTAAGVQARAKPIATFAAAERAYSEGQLSEAHRQLSQLRGVAIRNRPLEGRIAQLRRLVARALRNELTSQALYEEQHQKWADAANSWIGVCDGSPDDPAPHRRAALALVEARGDLKHALRLAKHAVALLPSDAETRRTVARVYLAAGLRLNARHELELATKLSRAEANAGDKLPLAAATGASEPHAASGSPR